MIEVMTHQFEETEIALSTLQNVFPAYLEYVKQEKTRNPAVTEGAGKIADALHAMEHQLREIVPQS